MQWAAWWVENDPFALAPFLPIGRLIHAGRLHPPIRERAVSGSAAFAHIEKKASQVTEFKDLGLSSGLLAAVRKQGYETPTPIQAQAIPPVLAGHDLLGVAQTGTGKTAAFALPLLHRMLENRRRPSRGCCRVLVLSPTRELAQQIAESFKTYGAGSGITVAVFVGGVKYGAQIKAAGPGVDVLVATPGRLLDHLQRGTIRLDEVDTFILDEADQMLDLGFVEPIRKVIRKLPKERQNLFFSATMPPSIAALAAEILRNPKEVRVTPQATTAERVNQRILHVEATGKKDLLLDIVAPREVKRVLIFTRTKRGADRVAKFLEVGGIEAAAIHGDKSQGQRERALAAFKTGKVKALVATDIAARGIDVDAVSHVINFELPNVAEAYVHRIGRTARAGAEGSAISLCDGTEIGMLREIEKITRQNIPSEDRRADQSRPLTPAKAEGSSKPGHRGRGRRPGPPQAAHAAPGGYKGRSFGSGGRRNGRAARV